MAESTLWWIVAGIAVAAELITGTFYLLMLAAGLAAAAVAAHLGAGVPVQLLVAAAVGGGAVVAWYFIRGKRPDTAPAATNSDVNMDIGSAVQVLSWNTDGTAQVKYRGAQWTVIPRDGVAPETGMHRVAEVTGNRLVVEKIQEQS